MRRAFVNDRGANSRGREGVPVNGKQVREKVREGEAAGEDRRKRRGSARVSAFEIARLLCYMEPLLWLYNSKDEASSVVEVVRLHLPGLLDFVWISCFTVWKHSGQA
ncbi:hypothetical protein RHGRI_020756 [Rhododendron griersonianum]|uniref:Uncharacterized protein n=1 Tax=Rhododendron griersonianum TaxID=479676 RepID=A0AAV6JNE5_9ERIC|nr:hypothetical protein RHGRI_020756 [Rhododendron griersonianum]